MSEGRMPKWKRDFAIDSESEDYLSRRDFIRFLTLVSGGLTAATGGVLAHSMMRAGKAQPVAAGRGAMDICDAGELARGNWLVFHYPDADNPALLIRRENGEFIAFSQKCPHLACPVSYRRSSSEGGESIGCHCHNGQFNIDTGQGVAGPPRELRPLQRIAVKVLNGRVVVHAEA